MRLIEGSKMRDVDRMVMDVYGIPGPVLMENACLRVLEYLQLRPEFQRGPIVVIAGKGNNGGDGLALFRHLVHLESDCFLVLGSAPDQYGGDALLQWEILDRMELDADQILILGEDDRIQSLLARAAVLVDGLFGTGFRGQMGDPAACLCRWYNASPAYKVAIDIPSGLNGDTGLGETVMKADATVTFGAAKTGLLLDGKKRAGRIWVGEISIPRRVWHNQAGDFWVIEGHRVHRSIGKREPDTHKGRLGKVLIIGGSPGLTGAVAMAARAAVRCGAGLVTAAVPEGLNAILEGKLTEPMTLPLTGDPSFVTEADGAVLQEAAAGRDALVVGPGMGRQQGGSLLIARLLTRTNRPLVLDADGLFHLSRLDLEREDISAKLILTPHSGEAARLLDVSVQEVEADRPEAARVLARRFGAVVVLKGSRTLVTDGRQVAVNTTGNPGMASGGTGDVLAGILGALAARGIAPFEAACAAVYLHGLAGDIGASHKTTDCLQAGDLVEALPGAFRCVRKERKHRGLLVPLTQQIMGEADETGMGRD